MRWNFLSIFVAASLAAAEVELPESLVAEGVPRIPTEVREKAGRYLDFRTATFNGWHPVRREILIGTRFAETVQLHQVATPMGARRQLTFSAEPVAGGSFRPKNGQFIVFAQDVGGGEFMQLFRYDFEDGRTTLLTDGKSRNTGARWARSGQALAYTSTRRNGKDNDLYVMDPANPDGNKLVAQVAGGGWSIHDWSPDEKTLLVGEYLSINESYLHLVDVASGKMEPLTPKGPQRVAWQQAQFSKDGRSVYVLTDQDSEFLRLCRMDLQERKLEMVSRPLNWDIAEFDLAPDGKSIACVANEDGVSVLRILEASSGRELTRPRLPLGVISGLAWHEKFAELGFTLSSARSPGDVYSYTPKTGRIERWTESETGGLNPGRFVAPELVKMASFDGLVISAFAYYPDPARFAGKRPALIYIHGGPEAQSLPNFLGRMNYLLDEMGIALIVPNVRGSAGYGKTFLTLDNGMKREDSVKDIGTVIRWAHHQPRLDADRLAVMGGSYGGYMTLASLVHFSGELRAGIDVVGISNFATFLLNTQEYRRDLRRVEYGDERDPAMRAFMEKIAPAKNVEKITRPLFVVQGKNDPRVPLSESEQMVAALRGQGGKVWYLMGKDEGHGFKKKRNVDYQFYATILFLRENLLE